jgi:hypothetical protein
MSLKWFLEDRDRPGTEPFEIGVVLDVPTTHGITGGQDYWQVGKHGTQEQCDLNTRTRWQLHVCEQKIDLTAMSREQSKSVLGGCSFD